jgi:cbb3-type cytochrome oxidase subunit 3
MSLAELYQIAARLWVLWLVLLFVGIIGWTFLPRNRQRLDEAANIPFNDDPVER